MEERFIKRIYNNNNASLKKFVDYHIYLGLLKIFIFFTDHLIWSIFTLLKTIYYSTNYYYCYYYYKGLSKLFALQTLNQ